MPQKHKSLEVFLTYGACFAEAKKKLVKAHLAYYTVESAYIEISAAPNFWTPEIDAPKTSITGSVSNIWGMLG